MGSKVRQADEYLLAEMLKTNIAINYDKFYKDDLIRMAETGRKLYKKQKEIIDRAKEYISNKKVIINTDVIRIFDLFEIDEQGYTDKLLSILEDKEDE